MAKKRTRLEVISDILKVIRSKSSGIKPTHILYKSNLSHQMMDIYLRELITKGFVKELRGKTGRAYALTAKGHEFLEKYALITEFTTAFGLDEREQDL